MFKLIKLGFLAAVFLSATLIPSKYTCRTGHIHIETSNRFTDIVADNYQVYSEFNPNTGDVKFTGLMKAFEFKMGALDQAFNSSRVDLSQFAKFNFEGSVKNFKGINFDKAGKYPATVDGFLYIGSYKRRTKANGTIEILPDGKMKTTANFRIKIEEASMNTINKLMKQKLPSVIALDTEKLGISRDIHLNLNANYRPR